MRIGVITTSYPRFAGDHAGSFVGAHVRALEQLGHEVDVVHADADEPLFYRGGAPDAIEQLGLRSLPMAASFMARQVAEVAWRARGEAPRPHGEAPKPQGQAPEKHGSRARAWDAAIAHWLVPSAIVAAVALPRRIPLLAIAHGGDVHTLRRTHLLGPVLRALKLRGATLAVVSDELHRMCAPWLDAIVQPMGIDVAHFAALGRAPTTPPTVGFIGRFVPIKGVNVFLAAMKQVATRSRVVVAGEGPDPVLITKDQHPWPAQHIYEVLGAVSASERDQILREASAIVVPSRVLANGRSEGTPMIALEALAAGVPVVASRVGGLAELPVVHVPPDDPPALAAAIDRVLAQPPERQSMAALDWTRVAARLLPA